MNPGGFVSVIVIPEISRYLYLIAIWLKGPFEHSGLRGFVEIPENYPVHYGVRVCRSSSVLDLCIGINTSYFFLFDLLPTRL